MRRILATTRRSDIRIRFAWWLHSGRQSSCRVQFLLVLRPSVNHQSATNWCSARGCASDRCGCLSRCALHRV